MGVAQDPALVAALQSARSENATLTSEFRSLQMAMVSALKEKTSRGPISHPPHLPRQVSALKEKTALGAQVEALAAEAQALQLDTSAATMSVAELEAALPRLQTELSMARDEAASAGAAAAAGAADADAMLAQLHAAQTEAAQLDAALSEARADLAKPVQQSRAFLSMRASLQKKNGVAKALQEKVKAHGLANDIEATED